MAIDTWFEGSRLFDIAFGSFNAAVCLAVALPTLTWCLARFRRWIFTERLDPSQFMQASFGVFGIAMAIANALCRYIPHRPLALVHPTFFVTTISFALFLAPFVLAARKNDLPPFRISSISSAGLLALMIAFPSVAVARAFGI